MNTADVLDNIGDRLDNILAVKGEAFARLVSLSVSSMQATGYAIACAEHESDKDVLEEVLRDIFTTLLALVAMHSKLTPAESAEASKMANQIVVDTANKMGAVDD